MNYKKEYNEKPDLMFKDAFTLNAFTKKVGNNYIVEVGKFIGGQVEVKKEEKERKYDIYMDSSVLSHY